ncbi:MFS transporter [Actinokineospora sp. 24-640]
MTVMGQGPRAASRGRQAPIAPAGERRVWLTIAALGGGAFSVGTVTFVVAGVLADLAADLGTTVGAAGLSVTAYAIGYAVGSLVLSAVFGAVPARLLLVSSLLAFAFFNAVVALAPTFEVLVAARVLAALAAAVYIPAAGAAALGMVSPNRQGRAMAVVLGGASAAGVAGAPLGVAMAAATSWRAAFALVAVLAGLAAAALVLGPFTGGPPRTTSLRERFRPLRSRSVLGVTSLAMTGGYSAYTYLGPMSEAAGWRGGMGLLIGVFGIGGVLGTSFGGVLVDRWGAVVTAMAALGLLTAAFAVYPLIAAGDIGILAFAFVLGLAAWACVPAQQHRLARLDTTATTAVLALNSSAVSIGLAAGAAAGGVVVGTAGAGMVWAFALPCCGASLALHAASARRKGARRS